MLGRDGHERMTVVTLMMLVVWAQLGLAVSEVLMVVVVMLSD